MSRLQRFSAANDRLTTAHPEVMEEGLGPWTTREGLVILVVVFVVLVEVLT